MYLSRENYKHQMTLLEACFTTRPSTRRLAAWWPALKHFTDDELTAGVATLIRTAARFPALSDIIAAARSARKTSPGTPPPDCPRCRGAGRLTIEAGEHPVCVACDCEAGKPYAAILHTVSERAADARGDR